ncbi:MAG: RNA polymerase sigma factor [Candidatus Kapabacteria bacterium]|nr:RNA polymerase sigma factor [Candidatus Kapabacteria bacterium]
MEMTHAMALSNEDAALVEDYLHGNREQAAARFVQQYQRFVYGVALRHLGGNHQDAQDVAQETFIRAFRSLHRFKGESSLQTWLYRIAVNTCLSYRRRWRRWIRLDSIVETADELVSSLPLPDREVEDGEFLDSFLRLLEQLPPKQRETFYLRYVEGLSYEEISRMLGVSVSGLKANYHHAIRKLATMLGALPSNGKRT